MKKTVCFLMLIAFSLVAHAQKQKSTDEILVEQAIIKFFEGLATLDRTMMNNYTTKDFLLLEDGEVWNMDTLDNRISPLKNTKFARTNHFIFLRTEIKGNTAWTAYDNKADISVNDWKGTVHWLESATLVKENGFWKVQMLHSTKIDDPRK